MKNKSVLSAGIVVIIACALLLAAKLRTVRASADFMILTVTDYEAGISNRTVQSHAPIGLITNPCSYADNFAPTIDWNDGSGEHKPDTNAETKLFYTKVPVIQNGVYLFWDDTHVAAEPGPQTVITKLTVHCLGDPPGDHVYVTRNTIQVYARTPMNDAEFTKNGKSVDTVKGHDTVDLTLTLDAPAPASGAWVKLETTPAGTLNSLPPYFRIPARQTQATISGMELREPASKATLIVTASTVGRAQQTQQLTILP
ncbi:MAG: hypothetical protein WA192_17630 [Candidatus Acidiferrales bacterium]